METTMDERRSAILVFFTFVANTYLVMYAADALVSVADELWFAAAGSSPLTALRNQLALIVVLTSVLMIFVVAFIPHLPRSLFLPLIVSAFWFAMGAPPFIAEIGDRTVSVFLSLVQLIIAVAGFLLVQLRAGRTLLDADLLPRRRHVFLQIVAASLVIIMLLPVGFVAFGMWALVTVAEEQTKGYINFTWSEVQTRETVLKRADGKTVHLIGTAHIAERRFYETIYANVPPHAVILAEGISDDKNLAGVEARARQGESAMFLGLQTQDVFENLLGPAISEDDAAAPAGARKDKAAASPSNRPDVVRADIDLSDLSPSTLRCLKETLNLGAGTLLAETLGETAATPACSDADFKVFWDEILYERNNHLLKTFDKLVGTYDTFIVPWGAMHMPDLELAFRERGFKVVRSRMLTLARYETVAGHVLGTLAAYRLHGTGNLPYEAPARR